MDTLLTGLILAVEYATPIVMWAAVYRLGRRLDLALDAYVVTGAVVFASILAHGGEPGWALVCGASAAMFASAILCVAVEWARVPAEIGSLLWAYAIFRGIELAVGESLSLPRLAHRLHPALPLPEFVPSLVLLCVTALVIEIGIRTHTGLMYRALADNPDLPVRRSPWLVRSIAAVTAAAVFGLAGGLQVDREGAIDTAFGLSRVVDGFIVAELTTVAVSRWRRRSEAHGDGLGRLLGWLAELPITLQLFAGAVLVNIFTYALLRYLPPSVPSLAEAIIVILMLAHPRRWRRSSAVASLRAEPVHHGLQIKGLGKSFRSGSVLVPVLANLEMSAPSRGLFVVVGAVGSGKSSLFRVLAGIVDSDVGVATLGGLPTAPLSRLLTQNPLRSVAPSLSIRENLSLAVGRRRGPESTTARLSRGEAIRILSQVSDSPALANAVDRPAASLSGGQQQLLACAMILVDRSRIVLADEPTKMLDQRHRSIVERQLLQLAEGRLVIMSTHEPRLDLAPADQHFVLEEGRLIPLAVGDGSQPSGRT